ncbi:CoB--CoM heterodisulfide reductase iron-sulfur subunit A family protein [Megalodesulfovibrio gigas]|uniref:Putative adenylylsulfate reductase-associated electron transfer protein QmoA n=2 Tax=Megalodesulfovibrio gigas TaxID=879 RepID=T2G856_MEGG1|nr:FAD-dependent oxidoreductase [Megalodesulfovibrio gigas]AGS82784.1 putative adenylylsulfate reductase-associated electron transfer protein QmoA [Megalodesulfovibrio gigas]AGW12369.1 putative adenylylsulfate reductase-associated electron transfer protein QmoA [Megalodesulfovibrio gigas DSM 1382 = ATCC 19364]
MSQAILVVGGGFSGITAALEAAEVGYDVYIVEKGPYLGGRVMQLNKYFPKLCPPSCGLEIQYQRIKNNPRVKFFTQAEVSKVAGGPGKYTVTVKLTPRHTAAANADLANLAESLSGQQQDSFNLGLAPRKPLFMDVPFAYPSRYVLDSTGLSDDDAKKLAKSPFINLNDSPKDIELEVGAIIIATGWKPYDVTRLSNLGAGSVPNCVSNMQLERLASPNGPTGGAITRPSDGKAPKKICFVQCAGSRDQNHLNFCSYICCMASLKQALYLREQYPDCECTVYYIDMRTPERYDKFLRRVRADEKINLVKGKVAGVAAGPGGDVIVEVEDAVSGIKKKLAYNMVVLATGMQPSLAEAKLPFDVPMDEDGFVIGGEERGIFVAGCAKKPLDVMKSAQSATGAAMKAINSVKGR